MIATEVTRKDGEILMLVTEHHQPGWLAQLFGAKPSSKTTAWHSTSGISWRNDQGIHEFDVLGLFPPYDCEKLYRRWEFLQKKYGPTLA